MGYQFFVGEHLRLIEQNYFQRDYDRQMMQIEDPNRIDHFKPWSRI